MTKEKSPFEKTKAAEANYARDLRRVAREVGNIIDRFGSLDLSRFPFLRIALEKYSELLRPWAEIRARLMVQQVDKADQRAWKTATEELSHGIREEIRKTPIGERFRELMQEQVALITSMPIVAAERVHELVIQNAERSGRASEIAREIQRSGAVAASRAATIARTEVSRTASVLTQARAEFVGSDGYVWRTAHDQDVRPSHRKMEGKFVRWDSPPTLDGLTGHAGALPNCRCYAEPVIPKELLE